MGAGTGCASILGFGGSREAGFASSRFAAGGSDEGGATGSDAGSDTASRGCVTAVADSTGLRLVTVTVTGLGVLSLGDSGFGSMRFASVGGGGAGSIAGSGKARRDGVTAAGGSTEARMTIAGAFCAAAARGGSTGSDFVGVGAVASGASRLAAGGNGGGAAAGSTAGRGATSRSGGATAAGGGSYRARATASPLSKSAAFSQSLARMASTRSSSHNLAISISKKPCSFWSINCMPWPVTAHCLPIQWMSRCSGIAYIHYLSRSMTLSPPI